MLSMVSFWLMYGILTVVWYGAIVYWIIPLVDKYLENLTDGDLKRYLSGKFVDPLFLKLGLHYESVYRNNIKYNDTPLSITVAVIGVLGFLVLFCSNLTQVLDYTTGKDKGFEMHELTVKMATYLSQEATLPIVIIAGALLLHTTFKKLYKFGKKVKPLVDEINREK
ncbi:hypothetical protein [Pseudoalteromonas phage PH357]|nr:hypothetical protein [Pseudoalteromonas phage PH357]